MNRCDEPHTGILLYLDNTLTEQTLEDFRAHLADCSDCSERLEKERARFRPSLRFVAGGEEVRSGGFTFHYRSGADSQVITWTTHGLTYALVSSLTGSPQRSCLVCHQDMAEQNLFKL
jgi:hypothetical protein